MLLEVENLRHAYGDQEVVRGLSFSLARGAIGCLLGPSGCGKTTVLRCIAGFEGIREGEIRLAGKVVSGRGVMLPPEQRRIGMVFQDYALFPHLSVAGNIAFGLHATRARERAARVAELAQLVGLSASLDKYPHEISGGQQQRVALARALAPRPELLLLDEPFSNLDVDLRERLSLEVRDIIKASGATAVLVTHDQQEAFAMADEIGVLHQGRIQQWDTPVQPLPPPGQPLRRRLRRPGRVPAGEGAQRPPAADRARRAAGRFAGTGSSLEVLLRPDDVVHDDAAPTQAEVVHKAFRGAEILYTLRLASGQQGARAGAEPPQPRARREDRHPPRRRPRGGVPARSLVRQAVLHRTGP